VSLYDPAALLVDHPALPEPRVFGTGITLELGIPIASMKLSRRERVQLAVQLAALTALLAELDLWPRTAALRRATVLETSSGLQVVVRGLPCSFSRVYRSIGGGEQAAQRMRSAVVEAVGEAVGLHGLKHKAASPEPGFFLEPLLHRLLDELPLPLSKPTARSLWAMRWDLPPSPEPGEVAYWSMPRLRTALGIGAALLQAERRKGRQALLWEIGSNEETVPVPNQGYSGTLVLTGELDRSDLTVAERWMKKQGCSAVVLGAFPSGWDPPPPPSFRKDRLLKHLVVTGLSLDRCRREVERRSGAFNPVSVADRAALSHAAAYLFDRPVHRRLRREDEDSQNLLRLLALSPDGVDETMLLLQTSLPLKTLRRRLAGLGAVASQGQWRLPEPLPMVKDTLHHDMAAMMADDSGRRIRHEALASGKSDQLMSWSRKRLDELDNAEVRAVLSPIAMGELAAGVKLAVVEACAAELDLAGARELLAQLPATLAAPWRAWVDAVDRPAGSMVRLLPARDAARAPRAAAEIALMVLEQATLQPRAARTRAERALLKLCDEWQGTLGRMFQIELAACTQPQRLTDRRWRRQTAGDRPELWTRLLSRRAASLQQMGRLRAAARMIGQALELTRAPGYQGLLHLRLGGIAAQRQLGEEAERHFLRAYRLLQVAGFRNRLADAVLALTTTHLDQLRIERAQRGFANPTLDPEDIRVKLGKCRLALARGDETRFLNLLGGIKPSQPPSPELVLLQGIALLLSDKHEAAATVLAAPGLETNPWLLLLEAALGRGEMQEMDDGWGVGLAARLIHLSRTSPDRAARLAASPGSVPPRQEMALALVERVMGRQYWIDQGIRRAASATLRAHGMGGWAAAFSGRDRLDESKLNAFLQVVERGGVHRLAGEQLEMLLDLLGLTGLQLRSIGGTKVIWSTGFGEPGKIVSRGLVDVVPLGGEPSSEAGWQLLICLIDMVMPSRPGDDAQASEEETGFYGVSEAACQVRDKLCQYAPTPMAVHLFGETGVGKEIAAAALHRLSGRQGRYVALNVAGISRDLIEVELFGSVKGAYTGAVADKKGMITSAHKGTLFLDEIGDLELPLQVKLLRFLESQEVRPVGSERTHQVDVRIITATHHDLQQLVANGTFREDLYFRVMHSRIVIPPLRQRRDDISVLLPLLEREICAKMRLPHATWSSEAQELLRQYHWPGNVRELRNKVEGAMVRVRGGVVLAEHLEIDSAPRQARRTWDKELHHFKRKLIQQTLEEHGGNRSAAARALGLSRPNLLYHMRTLGLLPPKKR